MSAYRNSRAAKLIRQQIKLLQGRKTQSVIAAEAGYTNPNNLSMIKNGDSKVALDRVRPLANALECDTSELFIAVLEQHYNRNTLLQFQQVFTPDLSVNELKWISYLRSASGGTDPKLTQLHARYLSLMLKPR